MNQDLKVCVHQLVSTVFNSTVFNSSTVQCSSVIQYRIRGIIIPHYHPSLFGGIIIQTLRGQAILDPCTLASWSLMCPSPSRSNLEITLATLHNKQRVGRWAEADWQLDPHGVSVPSSSGQWSVQADGCSAVQGPPLTCPRAWPFPSWRVLPTPRPRPCLTNHPCSCRSAGAAPGRRRKR